MALSKIKAFTLMELMIVVAIIAIISVIGGISINSRLRVSRLEDAALALASDASYARTSALFKGCPTRFVFCSDRLCPSTDISGVSVEADARYYATLRLSQYADSTADCYVSGSTDSDDSLGVLNAFDFDRKPQAIPNGIKFKFIYQGGSSNFDQDKWTNFDKGSSEANNSLWFPSSIDDSDANVGVANVPDSDPDANMMDASGGNYILFQLQFDDCDPTDSGDDCLAYFVVMDTSGETNIKRCENCNDRSANADCCF